jgi:hypothetical protein
VNEEREDEKMRIWIKKDVRKRKNIKMVLIEEEMRVLS